MNEVIENILTRRSVRAFTDKPVPRAELETLVKCALYAPSARNLQTWKFTVLTEKEDIRELAAAIGGALGRADYDMYRPAALIIPSNKADSPFGRDDNACALQNIFLAAHSLGIGSVWINQLSGICDEPEVRKVLDRLEIPREHIVFGMAALGYASDAQPKTAEKTGEVKFF
ncbi:MAG: nitroreductase [Bacteroides sp.]|nr:nitroreductase [Bacteroides sp.]